MCVCLARLLRTVADAALRFAGTPRRPARWVKLFPALYHDSTLWHSIRRNGQRGQAIAGSGEGVGAEGSQSLRIFVGRKEVIRKASRISDSWQIIIVTTIPGLQATLCSTNVCRRLVDELIAKAADVKMDKATGCNGEVEHAASHKSQRNLCPPSVSLPQTSFFIMPS